MSDILVRSTDREWDLRLVIFSGMVTAVAGLLIDHKRQAVLSYGLLAIGAIVVVGAIIMQRRRRALRRWVRDTGDGFVVIDRDGEREIDDRDIVSVAIKNKRNFTNGELKSVTREYLLWIDGTDGSETLSMQNVIPNEAPDPLAALIARHGDQLIEQAKSKLAAGHEIHRGAWTLNRQSLTLHQSPAPLMARVDELAAIDVVDGKLSLWRHGQDTIWARLPLDQPDAYLLHQLLFDTLQSQPKPNAPVSTEGLGRVIFERGTTTTVKWLVWSMMLGGLIPGIGLVIASFFFPRKHDLIIFSIPCFVTGFIGLALVIGTLNRRFRVHERGIFQSAMFSQKTLRYDDIASFQFGATRQYYNGAYVGTNFVLRFMTASGKKRDGIKYSVSIKNADDDLDRLRDEISAIIAGRMRDHLQAGMTVPWVASSELTPEGLVSRPPGFIKRKEPILTPYAQIDRYTLDAGKFTAFRANDTKPILQATAGDWNFYPGFQLLMFLVGNAINESSASPLPDLT